MRISDWSSDVCSSDLGLAPYLFAAAHAPGASISDVVRWVDTQDQTEVGPILEDAAEALVADLPEPSAGDETVDASRQTLRSEEGRDGKECVSTCRSRWSPAH